MNTDSKPFLTTDGPARLRRNRRKQWPQKGAKDTKKHSSFRAFCASLRPIGLVCFPNMHPNHFYPQMTPMGTDANPPRVFICVNLCHLWITLSFLRSRQSRVALGIGMKTNTSKGVPNHD
ncbi:MAG: hypothetical protein FWF96_06160 [Kiritimatiellaeota bacterium]|nr:hypothetical protein [Kiritimatiellota bacterium]